jgi:hypothetical protein
LYFYFKNYESDLPAGASMCLQHQHVAGVHIIVIQVLLLVIDQLLIIDPKYSIFIEIQTENDSLQFQSGTNKCLFQMVQSLTQPVITDVPEETTAIFFSRVVDFFSSSWGVKQKPAI